MNRVARLLGNEMAVADLVPATDLIHPDAAVAMDLWRNRKPDGLRIGRDVPSRAIARLLSRIAVCKPMADGDFCVHLAGSTIIQRFGRDITGERVSEVFDDTPNHAARRDYLTAVITSGEPRMVRITHRIGSVELLRNETVVLPVTAPNGKDRWALVFAFYF
jgi:hypothetical protein